jgi:hypothetical protein
MGLVQDPSNPNDFLFNRAACPHCGRMVEAALLPDAFRRGRAPEELQIVSDRSYCLCVFCLRPAIFMVIQNKVSLRMCTPEEKADFEARHGAAIRAAYRRAAS